MTLKMVEGKYWRKSKLHLQYIFNLFMFLAVKDAT